jgi:hypothetical protein
VEEYLTAAEAVEYLAKHNINMTVRNVRLHYYRGNIAGYTEQPEGAKKGKVWISKSSLDDFIGTPSIIDRSATAIDEEGLMRLEEAAEYLKEERGFADITPTRLRSLQKMGKIDSINNNPDNPYRGVIFFSKETLDSWEPQRKKYDIVGKQNQRLSKLYEDLKKKK